ncbi:MAG TPA: ABA4-like family protein [Pyrinomonadaceae bacterium]|jgi:glycopeptide antibiotics resistance protein|nr:ABA4-like family protein [Pyrinomonadaceae bacterium]
MNAETIFSIANLVALVGWLLLIFAPRWKWTQKIVVSGAVSLLLSVAYLVLIVLFFGKAEGGFGSLADVMKLFSNPYAALAGWIHYLAFDLFVGSWEVKDAGKRGISHWFVLPCLVLTFLLGPIGFLLYGILRLVVPNKKGNGMMN